MKSQRECHQALCEGKTLIHTDGTKIRYNEDGDQITQLKRRFDWVEDSRYFNSAEDWKIYEEPSATYEEAVAAKRVFIYFPGLDVAEHFKIGAWHLHSLMAFDLAARRHYRMEVVE